MSDLLRFTIVGVVNGAVYAIAASGLVVTYTTTGIFNFAHGALGMVLAFAYWELSVNQGVPVVVSLVLVLGVLAPLLGIVLERVLFRRLSRAPVAVSLVVTVGLLVLLLGAAQSLWPPESRVLPDFFPDQTVHTLGIVISYHQLTIIVVGLAVAFGLRLLLFQTRLGVSMRAVVDDPDLAAQNGILPERVAASSWAVGVVLAGIAGILLAPALTLDQIGLTLLVVNGYAAAILGRLRNLPLTYGGALIIGLIQSYLVWAAGDFSFGTGVLGNNDVLNELNPIVPVLFLFGVLVFLPQARLSVGRAVGVAQPRVPDLNRSLRAAVFFVIAAYAVSFLLSDIRLLDASVGLVLGMVMLSLVLLTGYGGQIALCQFSFVGIGALVMGKFFADGQLIGVLAAAVVTGLVGALVAIPALRLQDLYLALVTFAVALFADEIIFDHPDAFDSGGNIFFDGMALGPVELSGDRTRFLVAAVGFAAFGVLVLAIRRGPFGRRLAALSDSPAASATLGMNVLTTKAAVFAVSAAMAGAAGALYGPIRGSAGSLDFDVVRSLFVFLLATIGGITTVTGAFIGGVVFTALPIIQNEWLSDEVQLTGLFIGVGAIVVSRSPHGFAGALLGWLARLRRSESHEAPVTDEPLGGGEAMELPASDLEVHLTDVVLLPGDVDGRGHPRVVP